MPAGGLDQTTADKKILSAGNPPDFGIPFEPEAASAVEALEQIAVDLERLHHIVLENHAAAKGVDTPAMRTVATDALQKATGLCALLVSLLQEMPLH